MMLPPRTAKRQTPACGGVRFDPLHKLCAMPFMREPGREAKSMSGLSAESNPAWAGVHMVPTLPGGQKPACPPLASPTSQPHSAYRNSMSKFVPPTPPSALTPEHEVDVRMS
jgi:hypothetical protein